MTNWIVPRHAVCRVAPNPSGSFWNSSALDRLFDDVLGGYKTRPPTRAPAFTPRIDVDEADGELRLTAELPGLEDKDFGVTIDGDLLTIKGEKKLEREVEDEGRSVIERSDGSFERSFRFGWDVDPETVKASFKNGVLEVVIPKPDDEQPEPRTIPITTSGS
jgi:HSP20 family protein